MLNSKSYNSSYWDYYTRQVKWKLKVYQLTIKYIPSEYETAVFKLKMKYLKQGKFVIETIGNCYKFCMIKIINRPISQLFRCFKCSSLSAHLIGENKWKSERAKYVY